MADGEKKRFGNFAEYAKARQAGKLPVPGDFSQGLTGEDRQGIDLYHFQDQQMSGMQGPGSADQSRFMQSFSSSQTGQPPMGMMGGSSGLPMQQGLQRGMGAPSSSGLSSMGNMQMNRAPLGMSLGMQGGNNTGGMSALGLGRPASQQGVGQGMMGQRMPMQGGGGMAPLGISRPNTIGLQQGGGQPGYGPGDAGEILAMLNKGGMGGGSLNGAAQGQAGLGPPSMSRGSSGLQQLAGGQGPVGTGVGGPDGSIVGLGSQTEFSMEDDFPALPGASSGQGPNNSLMSGGSGSHAQVLEQFQRLKSEGNADNSDGLSQGPVGGHEKPDRYGMLGLLSVIRMVDENLNTLALGTDLTLLGLNLNASDNLYETFTSPWAETRASRTPEYSLPRCYYISPPALKTIFFQQFCDMTLFYIFYHFLTRPSDAQHQELRSNLVKYAYQELSSRGWQYQQEGNLWLKRAEGSQQLMFFDLNLMEVRPFVPGSTGPSSGASTPPNSTADGH